MQTTDVLTAILTLFAGIGVFLMACTMMSNNLESVSSNKLKAMFGKASKSKLLGVGIGTVGTAAIQSSGATSVMVIGFVNAGIMSLRQAATIIYGANIGTTITGQIVSLGMFGGNTVSTTVIFSAFAGVGAFIMAFAKRDIWQKMGGILAGFGLLFVGLSMMSGSMESFAQLDAVKLFLSRISNAVLLVIIGALLTAIIQSSSVMTSVAIAMVVTGLITLDQGIYLTMGSNIGSCVVAVIAAVTGGKNAKCTALIHLIFNISGVILFMLVGWVLGLSTGGVVTYGHLFEKMFPSAPQTQLAMFHTFFNVITVILILPLTDVLVKIVSGIVPDDKEEQAEKEHSPHLYFIDEHMLMTPSVAVQQTKNEILNMAGIAMQNFDASLDMICTQNFDGVKKFRNNEKELNFLNKELVRFVIKLSELPLNEKDHIYLSTTFHSISDLERVGDYAENIVEYAETLKSSNEGFSKQAIDEIYELKSLIKELFDWVMKAYSDVDRAALSKANSIEDMVDDMTNQMEENHIKRLSEGICTPSVGAQYLSLSSNSERVADHFINVAKTIKQFS